MTKPIFYLIAICIFMTACEPKKPSADDIQRRQTEQMNKEAAMKVGPPGIVNYTEKRFAKMLYELRDKEVKTYSYYLDMHGKMHFLCNSIGFGIPASVQYISPEKLARADCGQYCNETPMPQAEPNGLFMPDSLSATYVMCTDAKGKIHPVYFEPHLIVSPFKLAAQ